MQGSIATRSQRSSPSLSPRSAEKVRPSARPRQHHHERSHSATPRDAPSDDMELEDAAAPPPQTSLNIVGLPIREVRATHRPRKAMNKSCESNGRGFGWEIALHAASVTLVDSFHTIVARSHIYMCDTNVWDLCTVNSRTFLCRPVPNLNATIRSCFIALRCRICLALRNA